MVGLGSTDWISESFDGLTLSLTTDDFRGLVEPAPETEGAGDIGRDPGIGVLEPDRAALDECFFLCFFREDSFPLDSDRFGEPDLFKFLDFKGSKCLGRPDGVFVPLDEAPDGSLDNSAALALAFASSSLRLSISACFSSSDVSSSLYI